MAIQRLRIFCSVRTGYFVTHHKTNCQCDQGEPDSLVRTTMAYVRGEVVKLPSVFKDIPPNPLFGYDSPHTAPPSTVGSSEAATQSTLKHRLLLYDQRCLVTGGFSTQLQACHLVKPIRTNDSNRKIKEPLKELVVRVLSFLKR